MTSRGRWPSITLARPEAANAQNARMITEIDAALDLADADDDVRVVLLAADGKHFSAGHDLKELLAGEEPGRHAGHPGGQAATTSR